jgi:hypothetical protein
MIPAPSFPLGRSDSKPVTHTETLDKLYLEWSQFTSARTGREIALMDGLKEIMKSIILPSDLHEKTTNLLHKAL